MSLAQGLNRARRSTLGLATVFVIAAAFGPKAPLALPGLPRL